MVLIVPSTAVITKSGTTIVKVGIEIGRFLRALNMSENIFAAWTKCRGAKDKNKTSIKPKNKVFLSEKNILDNLFSLANIRILY